MTAPRDASLIQAELKQSVPIRSRTEEAFLGVLRTAAVVRRPLARELEARGLSLAQYNVLRILRGAGQGGMPTLGIRERMIEEAAGITRLIDKLERAELVRRIRGSTDDKRQVFCEITGEGLRLLSQVGDTVEREVDSSMAALTDDELDELIRLMDRVRAGMLASVGE